jgi:hypothetical protein
VLSAIRALAKKNPVAGGPNPDHCIHMASFNNFPTAAGLASSAAGYACMGKRALFPFVWLVLIVPECSCDPRWAVQDQRRRPLRHRTARFW